MCDWWPKRNAEGWGWSLVQRVWIIIQTILVFLLVATSLMGLAEYCSKGPYFGIKRQPVMGLITQRKRGSTKQARFPLPNTGQLREVEGERRATSPRWNEQLLSPGGIRHWGPRLPPFLTFLTKSYIPRTAKTRQSLGHEGHYKTS